jgi:5-methylcytosine-specific restriction protein A
MPMRAAKACSHPGCPNLVRDPKKSLCEYHDKQRKKENDDRRPSAAARGYGANWRRIRDRYLRDHPFCERCGKPAELVHHKVRLAEGGTNSLHNLESLCSVCHGLHHAKVGDAWNKDKKY